MNKVCGLHFIKIKNFNVKLGKGIDYNGQLQYGGRYIKVQKKGRLTNYPWQIGEIGTTLYVPECHSTEQLSYGDIWMTFDENIYHAAKGAAHISHKL